MAVQLLLVGGTGDLGGRIAARLAAREVPFRALVRATGDVTHLQSLGAELTVGDLTDPPSLHRSLAGIRTVITTANAVSRSLAGDRAASIADVDVRGNENLIRAAETAGVARFVFLSAAGLTDLMVRLSPFMAAKLHIEQVLRTSSMHPVVVRPTAFQELWLSPQTGVRPDKRLAILLGRGRSPSNDVAIDDVAAACVRLATMADPPELVEFGGPEMLTRRQVVRALERAYGARFRRVSVPRPVLRLGVRALRFRRPELASVLGMALAHDLEGCQISPVPLRRLGIEPRTTTDCIAAMAGDTAPSRPAPASPTTW